jgi:hypothetical protein
MPQFLIVTIAASMCVLCFAAGFIASVMWRLAERGTTVLADSLTRLHAPAPQFPNTMPPQPVPGPPPAAVTPQPMPHEETRAMQPFVVASQPIQQHELPLSPPQPQLIPQPEVVDAAQQIAALPFQHPSRVEQSTGVPPTRPPAAGKVYLFGDPHVAAGATPTFTPARQAPVPNVRPMQQHSTPTRLTPAELDLLPHRPQHSRDSRRRR